MKTRFNYRLSASFLILICVFMLIAAASLFYSLARIFGWFGLAYGSLALEITTAVLSALFFVLLICILLTSYKLQDGYLKLKLAFFDTTRRKFRIDKIVKVVKATNAERLYVNVFIDDTPQIVLVNIKPKDYEQFAKALRAIEPGILYEEAEINR
jgi:membrane protein implicated in regulation of membrane protease activity